MECGVVTLHKRPIRVTHEKASRGAARRLFEIAELRFSIDAFSDVTGTNMKDQQPLVSVIRRSRLDEA